MKVTWFVLLSVVMAVSAQGGGDTTPGSHLCEKTVRESVPEVVKVTKSFRVRKTKKCGFLWLKTCSSYSFDVKTVTKTGYRVREVNVPVCCNGTDSSGDCNTPKPICAVGEYGPKCELRCDCEVNNTLPEVCDNVSGYCFCLDGFGGPGCRQDLNNSSSVDDGYDFGDNETVVVINPKGETSEVAGGGDIIARIIIAVVVVGVVIAGVVIFFCCWRCKKRRKGLSSASSASDDFVVTLNPGEDTVQIIPADGRAPVYPPPEIPQGSSQDNNYYATPEEVRKRKRQEKAGESEETKPYDYVEMRSVSGQRPTLSGASSKPEVVSPSSSFSSSMARRVAERDSAAGRLSFPYANMSPTGSVIQDTDTSHYYMGETDHTPVSPTYSLMRRQDSGDSAFDDDGYCTSPNHAVEEGELQYAAPHYLKENATSKSSKGDKTENVYDSLRDTPVPIVVPPRLNKPSDNPEYANVVESSEPPHIYHHIPENQKISPDGYDHVVFGSSKV